MKLILTFILIINTAFLSAQQFSLRYSDPVFLNIREEADLFEGNIIPRLTDWDDDGDTDLLISAGGKIYYLLNTGKEGEFNFADSKPMQINNKEMDFHGYELGACLYDLNNDGLEDLLINYPVGRITVFYNNGKSGIPDFGTGTVLQSDHGNLQIAQYCQGLFDLTDWDNDGLLDLLIGEHQGTLTLYKNIGTKTDCFFTDGELITQRSREFFKAYRPSPRFFDVNNDGISDLLFGVNWGNIEVLIRPPTVSRSDVQALVTLTDKEGNKLNLRDVLGWNTYPEFIDYNNDGIMDLLAGGETGRLFILYGLSGYKIPDYKSDYALLADGLDSSSFKINSVRIPPLISQLDYDTCLTYFKRYFADHKFNLIFNNNLSYYAFFWGDNYYNIQKSMSDLFLTQLHELLNVTSPDEIETIINGVDADGEFYFSMLVFLAKAAKNGTKIMLEENKRICRKLLSIIKSSPLFYLKNKHLDKNKYPYTNIIRAQLLLTAFSFANLCGQLDEFISSIRYRDLKFTLLKKHQVLIMKLLTKRFMKRFSNSWIQYQKNCAFQGLYCVLGNSRI